MSQLLMDKYEELCEDGNSRTAELFFEVQDLFQRFSSFDPVSGEAIDQPFSVWIRRMIEAVPNEGISMEGYPSDRLTRLFEHAMSAISRLMEHLRSNVTREYVMLPVYAVRELDSSCVMWLARQPGRNYRQKLSGKKRMKALHRFMSLDTLENRLLKAYIAVVCDLLEQRKDFGLPLGAEMEFLFDKLRIWLKGEAAAQIGRWVNSVPNNVLLQDGSYSKVWKSWGWLQSLEADTEKDIKRLDSCIFRAVCWYFLSLLFHEKRIYLIERICSFDYEALDITCQENHEVRGFYRSDGNYFPFVFSCTDKMTARIEFGGNVLTLRMDSGEGVFRFSDADGHENIIGNVTQPLRGIASEWLRKVLAAMDIEDSRWEWQSTVPFCDVRDLIFDVSGAYVRCLVEGRVHEMPCRSVVQRLQGEWQSLRYSRAITVSGDDSASVYSMRALCLDEQDEDIDDPILANKQRKEKRKRRQEAAQMLVGELKADVDTDSLARVFYLVPDVPDDFCMTDLRRQFNIYFPDSQPIPRSIAGAFEWFERQGTSFTPKGEEWLFVLDEQGQGVTLTPIQIYIDEQWKEAFPEGQGVILERHPAKLLRSAEEVQEALEKIAPSGIKAEDWRKIVEVWGIEAMTAEGESVLWCIDDATPFAEKRPLEELWHQLAVHLNLSEAEVKNACEEYWKEQGRCEYIDISPEKFLAVKAQSARDVMCGVEILNSWQGMAPENVYLWCDHLPALEMKVSLNGRAQYIDLVEGGHRMQPKRGIRQKLPAIHTPMELPKGQKKITFPLFQGNLTDENARRRVSLSSNYFPLMNALDVSLEMYYTYGAEYPYELIFVGKGKGKEKIRISAEWESMETKELEDWMVPTLPDKPKLDELINEVKGRRYRGRGFEGFDDFLPVWLDDLVEEIRLISANGVVSERNEKYLDNVFHRWRKPVLQLRRLGMFDTWPYNVKRTIDRYLPELEELYFQTTDLDAKYCILRFACVMGDYMPPLLAKELVRLYKEKRHEGFIDIERWAGYALGSLKMEWQKEIWEYAFGQKKFHREEGRLYLFAIALWMEENFVTCFSTEYVAQVLKLLVETAKRLRNGELTGKRQALCLKNYMETAIGLMRVRARSKQDYTFWKLLNPQKLVELCAETDRLIDYVQKNEIEHERSFLDIDAQRPNNLKDMDPLYYVASRIISCESQDDNALIKIKGYHFE